MQAHMPDVKLTVAAGHESAVAQGQQSPTCRGTVVVAHGGANDGGANDWFNDVLTESFVPAERLGHTEYAVHVTAE